MTNELIQRARTMRIQLTDAEKSMWTRLRNRQLCGFKFSRQFVIEDYIVDFICREKNLIIELDGSQHLSNVAYDNERTKILEAMGYRLLRFWNNEVLADIDCVLECIVEKLNLPHQTTLRSFVPAGPVFRRSTYASNYAKASLDKKASVDKAEEGIKPQVLVKPP